MRTATLTLPCVRGILAGVCPTCQPAAARRSQIREAALALRIEETFQVRAPAARVWQYLIDPRQVVSCLPGAELLEVADDQTFLGQVRVKVGPITTAYKGRAKFEEIDEAARQVRMSGEGRETAGAGSAKMAMSSQVVELPDGAEVRVVAELDVVGRIVQFGRGMIEEVSRQLFAQFADCVRSTLETEPAAASDQPDATPVETGTDEESATAPRARHTPAAAGAKPVRLLPVLLAAAWNRIRRLLGR